MLAKKHRLTSGEDFTKIEKEGRVYQFEDYGLAVFKRFPGPSRFAFVVSTKIAKDAVDRNRIKRALGEAIRLNVFYIKDGYDIIFLSKRSIARKQTETIMREVKKSLTKAGLFKEQ